MNDNSRHEMMNRNYYFIFGLGVLALSSFFIINSFSNSNNVAFAQDSSITIITIQNDNSLIEGAEYSIHPNPFNNQESLLIKDNGVNDQEKEKKGIIVLSGVKNGKYTIKQTSTISEFNLDKISKIVEIKDSSDVVSFTNYPSSGSTAIQNFKDITYTAKFVCGSVFGSEGPLRPGHYDSDISILNKQNYDVGILWNVVVNGMNSSHAIAKKLTQEESTSIVCKDIRNLSGISESEKGLLEGFAIIRIPLDSSIGTSGSTVLRNLSSDTADLLDVQVFYTANALDTLPHEVIVEKISFYIIQDESGKIPKEMIRKVLDVSIPSTLNQITDTSSKVKNILAEQHSLSSDDLDKIVIRIKDVSIGVGSLIDDHAISLHVVKPQINS